MKRYVLIATLGAALLLLGILYFTFFPIGGQSPEELPGMRSAETSHATDVSVVAEDLFVPWDIAFLPDGDMLVTERDGTLRRFGEHAVAIPISSVRVVGEGGLLGMALHPNFEENHFLYLYVTRRAGLGTENNVERYELDGEQLLGRTVIIEGIPGGGSHDGGRLAFGPDGYLYVTTGDAGNERSAQDPSSLAGKILRVRDDGSIPEDNPFHNAVYSFGHRNPQGIDWDPEGRLWATEHGRSGLQSGYDEVNLIRQGGNYGWPDIEGGETAVGMTSPIAHSGGGDTWAPASALYWDGSIFFAGLRGAALYEAVLRGTEIVEIKAHLKGQFGRLRAIALGPDGFFYLSTSNRDGRGEAAEHDDKIIRIDPIMFR